MKPATHLTNPLGFYRSFRLMVPMRRAVLGLALALALVFLGALPK